MHYFENEISFSYGKIISISEEDDEDEEIIFHDASTLPGSSDSPIIRRGNNNYVIGLHVGSNKNYNLGTPFNLILNNIKKKEESIKCNNYIICKYTKNNNNKVFEIFL